ncbi:zinc finger protein 574-like isoform X1 [Sinocyclocheilus anshuiensis]|uniref:Zinc finger protein 574-like n=1 Tax=Sinocyclocheilus anshuiensis TaxID=1608454 RepID=A0A671SZH4_9TELE|nr:PREDICTED: zinc finger protein 574-like isoform X1 [Sinocyclocheilus anshuiensis]XP_016357238.1 PREDICTED: zinc finger protein 574-like isoform X1 [Sinocyclocheilus anshuiensis]
MSEQEYVEHQYMCSECQQLFNTLEEVLVHQQIHTGAEGDEVEVLSSLEDCDTGESQYQCLECGAILRNPDELLLHQELHMREAGQELCEVTEMDAVDADVPIQYQCLECLALFDTPELWLAHRQTHNRSSTHSSLSTDTEYVLQADGSVTPLQLLNVQNLVLDEQKAGQILTLAQALREQENPSKTAAPHRTMLVPANASLPGSTSAMLRLQFCSAQAIADGSASATLRKAKLLAPLLPADPIRLDNVTTFNLLPSSGQVNTLKKENEEILIIHPYECSECNLLFSTPEDFLQHQGEHFLGQDKESGDTGVMVGYEDRSGAKEDEGRSDGAEEGSKVGKVIAGRHTYTARSAGLGLTPPPSNLRCEECKRTFTSANRLVAHLRVHEQGTHECPECDKVFKKLVSLQTHMRTHSGEARFLCVDCGHGFTTEMTLMIHRKSHTSEPLHKCPFCAKTFTNMTKFLYHRRTHRAREPTEPVSQFVLAQQSPLSIIQRAREREAAWRKERHAVTIPPVKDDRKESSDTGSVPIEGIAVVSQSSEPTENGLHAEPSNTEQTQNGGKILTIDPNHSTTARVEGGGEEPSKHGTPAEEEPKFPCSICKKRFPSQVRLLRHHRTTHTTERRFKCNICGKPFKKQIHLRNHLRTHTGERPFQCSVCGKTFSSLANLSRHGLTHTGVRPYRCDICHKAFSQSSNLRQHRQHLHSNVTPSPCPDCSATFIRPAKLVAHRFLHHPGSPAPYPCPHCSEGFLRKRQRDLHCLEEHPNLTQLHSISQDSQVSSQQGSMDNTEQLSAPSMTKPNLDCTICGKRLNSPANLRLHQLSHGLGPGRPRGSSSATGKSHPCPVCGKLFGSASSVTLHQRVHTGERPYPCVICGKRFRQNTHLREHLRTHSGERPFRCEFCDKGFVQSMHLAEHRRTHTGERPHACGECGKTFKTVSNLRNHRKTHNRTQKQQEPEHSAEAVAAESQTATVAVVEASEMDLVPAFCQQEVQLGQPQVIQIQTSNLTQTQGTPTIMFNELGETIAIIETSGDLAEAIELYHTALESGINMEAITVDNLQLM